MRLQLVYLVALSRRLSMPSAAIQRCAGSCTAFEGLLQRRQSQSDGMTGNRRRWGRLTELQEAIDGLR